MAAGLLLSACLLSLDIFACHGDQQMSQVFTKSGPFDVIYTSDILFIGDAKSKLDCGLQCAGRLGCVMFTFTRHEETSAGACRGHSSTVTSSNASFEMPRSKAFVLLSKSFISADFTVNGPNTACTSNAQCTANNAECFESLCRCSPGYYYSHSGQSCVDGCIESDLQTTYTMYPEASIHPHEIDSMSYSTASDCLGWCSGALWCRTVKYYRTRSTCYRFQTTALNITASEWYYPNSGSDLYQKTCA